MDIDRKYPWAPAIEVIVVFEEVVEYGKLVSPTLHVSYVGSR